MLPPCIRVLGFGLLLLQAAAPPPADADEAEGLLARGLFAKALPLCEKSLAASPGDVQRSLRTARCLGGLQRYQEAIRVLETAAEKHPEAVELLVMDAEACLQVSLRPPASQAELGIPREYMKRAESVADRALALDPKNLGARVVKASCILARFEGDPREAQKILEAAVADHPKAAAAHIALGRFRERVAAEEQNDAAKWALAEQSYGAALELEPENAAAAWGTALSRFRADRNRSRLADFEKAALLGSEQAVQKIAEFYPKGDRLIPVLDRLLEKRPGDPVLLFHKAVSLAKDGKADRAALFLREARTSRPDDPHLALAAGQVLVLMGRGEEGVAEILGAVELCGGVLDRRVYDTVDRVAVRWRGLKADQRERLWEALWKAWPREINAPANAEVWFRDSVVGGWEKSLTWCQRALEVDPEDPMVLNDLGLIYNQEGAHSDPAKAEEAFRKAVAMAEKRGVNDPEKSLGYKLAVDNLVNLLLGQRRNAEVLDFADKHLKGDPRGEAVRKRATEAK